MWVPGLLGLHESLWELWPILGGYLECPILTLLQFREILFWTSTNGNSTGITLSGRDKGHTWTSKSRKQPYPALFRRSSRPQSTANPMAYHSTAATWDRHRMTHQNPSMDAGSLASVRELKHVRRDLQGCSRHFLWRLWHEQPPQLSTRNPTPNRLYRGYRIILGLCGDNGQWNGNSYKEEAQAPGR